ncbi:L,D-transpeptidase family protein [Verrucomicrobiota bacterium]
MKITDFDDFRRPNRKPWFLLILLVIVALICVQRYRREDKKIFPEKPSEKEVTAVTLDKKGSIDSPFDIKRMLAQAKNLKNKGSLANARSIYLEILKKNEDAGIRAEVERNIGDINIKLVFSPMMMPEKVEYIVKPRDLLQKIARRYGTTVELIQKSNKLKNPDLIKTGDVFRVLKGKFTITVDKSDNEMVVCLNDEFFKKYRVGTGEFGKTPTGTFIIKEKIPEPPWWRGDGSVIDYTGDPKGDNILGTRWMSLRATGETPDARGYGIHGTWDSSTVGKSLSAGCIRLKNNDVEELFALVREGTKVTIVE